MIESTTQTYLRVKRLLAGMDMDDLAAETQYSRSTLSMVERGAMRASKRVMQSLCDVFGCEGNELFEPSGIARAIPKKS